MDMWYNVLGRIQNDPTENFSYKRKSIHFVNTPNEDVQKLLQGFDKTTFAGLRDYCIIVTILDTGIRPSEALCICEENVNFPMKEIRLPAEITKTRKERPGKN